MQTKIQKSEVVLLLSFLAMLLLAVFGPALAQSADHHHFADQRVLEGIPYAMDVLSNLPFVFWGLAGFAALQRLPKQAVSGAQRAMAMLFFTGLIVTAAGSAWYHSQPDDAGLFVDRCGMVLAFAGLLGLAVADRISGRAGVLMGLAVLLFGPLSVWVWSATGNVLPWAVIQFGGMLLVCALALRQPEPGALGVRLGLVIGLYAVAKLLELGDHQVWHFTGGFISGHSLKHLTAALVAWPVIIALGAPCVARHNRIQSARGRSLRIQLSHSA